MECELCGKKTEKLQKVKIESTVLEVCKTCAKAGKTIKTNRKGKKQRKEKKKEPEKYLVSDYGKIIKEAREEKGLTIEELANEINEKESVIRRLENRKLKPDEKLENKLSKKLGVSLYEERKEEPVSQKKSGKKKELTIGDVAEVKEN